MINKIGSYKLIKRIASGGMADVYLAYHKDTGLKVAIKLLKEDLLGKEQIVERFSQEGLLKLTHPNIVKIFSVGSYDGRPYIIMEYIEGSDLDDLIKINRRLSVNKALSIFVKILSALSYVHKYGIIHRDIKPKNILIDRKGAVKLTDFGIAKSSVSHIKTSTGSYLGAPAYSSPEQIDGKPLDGRTDIYSLGVTLYEMLAGVTPFSSDSIEKTYKEKFIGIHVPITRYRRGLSEKIIDLIEKCIAKNPNDRFRSVDEILQFIRKGGEIKKPRPRKLPIIIGSVSTALIILVLVLVFNIGNDRGTTLPAVTRMADNDSIEEGSDKIIKNINYLPVINNAIIILENINENDDLELEYSFEDLDDNNDRSVVKWYKNDEYIQNFDGLKTINNSELNIGETWRAVIIPYDGKEYGEEIKTNDLIIPAPLLDLKIISDLNTLSAPHAIDIKDNYAYIADCHEGLKIIDISNKSNPYIVGSLNTPGHPTDIYIEGNYIYIADGESGLLIIDISNKGNPYIAKNYKISDQAIIVAIEGNYAYIADGNNLLSIIDIDNNKDPFAVGDFNLSDNIHDIVVKDNYVYIANCNSGLQIMNVKDKANPNIEGSYNDYAHIEKVCIEQNYAYLLDGQNGLQILNIIDNTNPELIGVSPLPSSSSIMQVYGYFAFVFDNDRNLHVIDITNKEKPFISSSLNLSEIDTNSHLFVEDDYIYITYSTKDNNDNIIESGLKIVEINNQERGK